MKTNETTEHILAQGTCPCGGKFMYAKLKNIPVPKRLHTDPACDEFNTLPGIPYLQWVASKTGKGNVRLDLPRMEQLRRATRAANRKTN